MLTCKDLGPAKLIVGLIRDLLAEREGWNNRRKEYVGGWCKQAQVKLPIQLRE